MIDKRHLDKWELIEKIGDWEYCKLKSNYKYTNELTPIVKKEPLLMTKEIFEACPFKDKIFKDYAVQCVVLGGSYLYNAYDDISDYDLTVFTEDVASKIQLNNECLFYNGRKVHWYYQSFSTLLNTQIWSNLTYLLEFYYLKSNHFLYVSDNILYNRLLENKSMLYNIGINGLILYYRNLLYKAYINQLQLADINAKPLHKLLLIYYIINNEQIDNNFVVRVKRCRYSILSADDFNKILKMFSYLYKYYFILGEK